MLYQYCLPFAVIACSVLGKIVQVSHSSEEVLALKKEIARCQVEADKLRTAISLNKVCSGIYAANALPQSLMDNPVPAPPPPPPPRFSCIVGFLVCCMAGFCTQPCFPSNPPPSVFSSGDSMVIEISQRSPKCHGVTSPQSCCKLQACHGAKQGW